MKGKRYTGMRKMGILRLRIKDVNFEQRFRAAEHDGTFGYCFVLTHKLYLRRLSLRPPLDGGEGLKSLNL